MIRRDMPEVLDLELRSFDYPWSEEDFIRCLRQRNCIGMVAEYQEKVIGYMIYELHKSKLHILNFAVHPEYRRRGVASSMMGKLIGKLNIQKRSKLILEVSEDNLDMHLFLKNRGFVATSLLKCFYEQNNRDAYQFVYALHPENLEKEKEQCFVV